MNQMNQSWMRFVISVVFVLSATVVLNAEDAGSAPEAGRVHRPRIGDKLGTCSFTDIRFLPRSLSDFVSEKDPVKKRAFVLVFTNTTCPIVQRFLPRLKQLEAEFRDQGVQFVAIDVGVDDSILEIATQALEHDMPFPFVKDLDGSCVAACGVDRTATAVVVDADHKLRYRGRIDNSFRLGGTAPGAASTELRDAIGELLAGDEIKVSETPVDGCLITKPTQSAKTAEVSYTKQIAPILDRHCNTCHRPGTSAPFSLMSYDDVAANAAMIAEVVDLRRMPPWYASPHVGTFTNNRTLPASERKLLMAWARAGAPHDQEVGSEPAATASHEESPAAAKVTADPWAGKEWQFGEPDIVFEAPLTYDVPPDGYIDYKYTLLPTVFLHDTYIQAAEIQPSNPRVVHHSNLGYMPIGTEGSLRG